MQDNPYASPAIPADYSLDANRAREIQIASQGKRFIHFIVDTIVIQILVQVGGFALGMIYGLTKVATGGQITPEDVQALQIIGFFWGLSCAIGYYLVMESLFQRTAAKFLTGCVVVNLEGQKPTFNQILGRSFARLIPFEVFSFFGTPTVGWHDSLSKTLVINAR